MVYGAPEYLHRASLIQMEGYEISTDTVRLDLQALHAALRRMYWCEDIPRELLAKAIENSINFAVYTAANELVGFARVITDRATFAYLCDVYVLENHRGRGLSRRLMEAVTGHPELQGLRRFLLMTHAAHGRYEQFGFTRPAKPDRIMKIARPGIYERPL